MKKNQLLCLALAALLALCCISALAESAAAPVCQQPTKDGKLHGHWYGEWFPTRVKHHTAFCRYDGCGEERETSCERITLSAGEATTAKLCPVCGGVDGVRGFAAVAAQVTGVDRALPQGEAIVRVEQPRGEAFYYTKANGTKFLERFRVRTPTFTNLYALLHILPGSELADVPLQILTIDPCISCTER